MIQSSIGKVSLADNFDKKNGGDHYFAPFTSIKTHMQEQENPNKHSIIIKISKWCKYTILNALRRARTTIIILNNVAVFRH